MFCKFCISLLLMTLEYCFVIYLMCKYDLPYFCETEHVYNLCNGKNMKKKGVIYYSLKRAE
jgi:hypothetical protein